MPVDIDLQTFCRQLAVHLRLDDEDRFEPTVSLFDDWALDSLQAFEMIVVIEAMAGATVPPPTLPDIFTLADAFHYYLSMRPDDLGM